MRRFGASAPIPAPVLSLRSETAGFCSPRCPLHGHPHGSPIVHNVDSGLTPSPRFRAPSRYRPSLAIRRPSTTIRQDRSLSQAPVATPAALPRYHLRRLLPPLTACRLHSAPAPARRIRPLESKDEVRSAGLRPPRFGYAQTPLGLRCSLSLRRSRDFF